MPRPKTPAERGLSSEDGTIKVGTRVRFPGSTFIYRVVEIRKNRVISVGDNGSELSTEADCLEIVEP